MKKIILFLIVLSCLFTHAQNIQRYYDWQWKPCEPGLSRFYSVMKNTDSGWFRTDYFTANNGLQMIGLFRDSACEIKNGYFVFYYANGNVSAAGRYADNKKDGMWLSFYYNGMMSDSLVYETGRPIAVELGWHQNGYMSDSSVYKPDGSGVRVFWFDNGTPSAAGKTIGNKKDGRWVYFHKNGKTAAIEDYREDVLTSKTYFDEEGKELTDTTNKDRQADFNGGNAKWQKYLQKNLVFPYGYKLINTDVITVVIAATINEEGNIENAYVEIPFKAPFDSEALKALKRSPKWLPAISHNRRVKMNIRQAVSFRQDSN
jgi:antitoxin component YwqK of YwqJK toxin-antitoxin module